MFSYTLIGRSTAGEISFEAPLLNVPLLSGPFHVSAHIKDGRLTAVVKSPESIEDILTFRNVLEDALSIPLDALCLARGIAREICIDVVVDQNGLIYDVPYGDGRSDTRFDLDESILCSVALGCKPLQFALKDFRLAVRYPSETGYFVHRAIENLARCFGRMNNNDAIRKTMKIFYSALNVPVTDTEFVFRCSGMSRHGGRPEIAGEDRIRLHAIARNVIRQFLAEEHYRRPWQSWA